MSRKAIEKCLNDIDPVNYLNNEINEAVETLHGNNLIAYGITDNEFINFMKKKDK